MDAGHPFAVIDLSDRIRSGRGINADPQQANALLEQAASSGVGAAATKLGHLATDANNYNEAKRYYTVAAEAGEPTAMLCLAIRYRNGMGVEKDEAKALVWLHRAAECGDETAQSILSHIDKQ